MQLKRGDLIFAWDPIRPTGSHTGFRGMCLVDNVGSVEVTVRPLTEVHNYVRLKRDAIHIVFAATHVASEEIFK